MLRDLSLALFVAFASVTFSAEAYHCVAACGDCDDGFFELSKPSPHPELRGPDAEESAQAPPACAGPTCLCHQHSLVSAASGMAAAATITKTKIVTPRLSDLGVVLEILHVPKTRV